MCDPPPEDPQAMRQNCEPRALRCPWWLCLCGRTSVGVKVRAWGQAVEDQAPGSRNLKVVG